MSRGGISIGAMKSFCFLGKAELCVFVEGTSTMDFIGQGEVPFLDKELGDFWEL